MQEFISIDIIAICFYRKTKDKRDFRLKAMKSDICRRRAEQNGSQDINMFF